MKTVEKTSLATRLAALPADEEKWGGATAEAKAVLQSLRQEYPEFDKYLAQKFYRLPEGQQHALLQLMETAQARECAALLQQWSQQSVFPLALRLRVMTVQETLGLPFDVKSRDILVQAEAIRQHLQRQEDSWLTATETLPAPWDDAVNAVPLPIVLEMGRELVTTSPAMALALLRTVQPHVSEDALLLFIETVATIPLQASVTLLQDILAKTNDKAIQKAIKKALHQLKSHGLEVVDTPRTRVVVGTTQHRLEHCLASFIDGAGDRLVLMIRTKTGGGYSIAYLILNYGLGIRQAIGLRASKRELPELLARTQERTPLIDLDPAYCQYQVALVHQMNLESSTPVPEEFFLLRDIIGESPTTFDRAWIYTELSAAELEAAKAYTSHAGDLLNMEEFAGWMLPAAIIQKYGDALQDLEQSQIVVSPAMQRERQNEIYEQAMDEVLRERSRRIMRLRLEEMAYYLYRTERRQEALWAVAAAQSLLEENPQRLRYNPFAGALLERTLESAKRHSPRGRIITPFSRPPAAGQTPPPTEERRIII